MNSVNGRLQFTGHHSKGAADGKSTSYGGYAYHFKDYLVESIRMSVSSSPQVVAVRNTNNTQSRINNNNTNDNDRTFNSGDRVLAMWSLEMWQYFPATIVRKVRDKNQYEIDWDDGDTTGLSDST